VTTSSPAHEKYVEQFSDYMDGALAAPACAELEEHLAGCAACRDELERLRKAVGALAGLGKIETPGLSRRVTETIARRSAGRFFGRRAFGDRVPFELLAVVGLILAAVLALFLRGTFD
jgi:anti-sigma factor RsiW